MLAGAGAQTVSSIKYKVQRQSRSGAWGAGEGEGARVRGGEASVRSRNIKYKVQRLRSASLRPDSMAKRIHQWVARSNPGSSRPKAFSLYTFYFIKVARSNPGSSRPMTPRSISIFPEWRSNEALQCIKFKVQGDQTKPCNV